MLAADESGRVAPAVQRSSHTTRSPSTENRDDNNNVMIYSKHSSTSFITSRCVSRAISLGLAQIWHIGSAA
jgi:hypothetical protein